MKIVKESFDEMDAAYEMMSEVAKKYGKDYTCAQVKELSKKYAEKYDLDAKWIYEFAINDVANEIGLNESKKSLNESLSVDKEAFIILDKLANDLKKIYDEDGKGYKIHEQQRLNDVTNDLIELQIDYVIIKDLVHYVAQNVYERKYSQEDLLKKLEEVKFKYSNVLNKDDKKEESLKLESVGSDGELSQKLHQLKDAGYLSFDAIFHPNDGTVMIMYESNYSFQGYDTSPEVVDAKELRQRFKHDLNFLKQYNAEIEEEETGYNEETRNYTIVIYYE